jgi:hypothetical protein
MWPWHPNRSFDVVLSCTHLNPFKCQRNWNALLIFHHINVDANPLLHINNGYLICTNNNIINFWNDKHHLWKDHIMNGLNNLLTIVIWSCFNGVFFTFSNKNNFPQWYILQYGSAMQENVQHNWNWMNYFEHPNQSPTILMLWQNPNSAQQKSIHSCNEWRLNNSKKIQWSHFN